MAARDFAIYTVEKRTKKKKNMKEYIVPRAQSRKNKTTKNRQIEVTTWVANVCVCVFVYAYIYRGSAQFFVRHFADWVTDWLSVSLASNYTNTLGRHKR